MSKETYLCGKRGLLTFFSIRADQEDYNGEVSEVENMEVFCQTSKHTLTFV